jgi:hypothetical protein
MKRLLTYLALVGFTAVSVLSVGRAVRSELEREPAFDAPALGAWLVAPTNTGDKPSTLRRAARQLEQEFHEGFDRGDEYRALDEVGRQTYEANWRRLLVTLVRQQADAFAATPEHLRTPFVNQRLTQFAGWHVYHDGRRVSAAEFLERPELGRITTAADLDPAERRRILAFVEAMRAGAFNKFWGRILPGGKPAGLE